MICVNDQKGNTTAPQNYAMVCYNIRSLEDFPKGSSLEHQQLKFTKVYDQASCYNLQQLLGWRVRERERKKMLNWGCFIPLASFSRKTGLWNWIHWKTSYSVYLKTETFDAKSKQGKRKKLLVDFWVLCFPDYVNTKKNLTCEYLAKNDDGKITLRIFKALNI